VEGGNLLLKKKHIDMLKEREYNNYGWVQYSEPHELISVQMLLPSFSPIRGEEIIFTPLQSPSSCLTQTYVACMTSINLLFHVGAHNCWSFFLRMTITIAGDTLLNPLHLRTCMCTHECSASPYEVGK
jgi:hypothetical protein